MARKLKVYCTPIGFHDAYVAAASQKEALAAWGSEANLFARGMAALVSDPKLTKEPLSRPGEVIKKARGTPAQHLAALPAAPKAASKKPDSSNGGKPTAVAKPAKHSRKPSRRALETAERAVRTAIDKYRDPIDALRQREEALQRERRGLAEKRDRELAKLQRRLDATRIDFDNAMEKWRSQ